MTHNYFHIGLFKKITRKFVLYLTKLEIKQSTSGCSRKYVSFPMRVFIYKQRKFYIKNNKCFKRKKNLSNGIIIMC